MSVNSHEITEGEGRTRVCLAKHYIGTDLIVHIYNENGHIGAVALGEYDHQSNRASTSVITRLGHKDDVVALKAAHTLSKKTQKPVCVIAGIHLDDITQEEIAIILNNCTSLVERALRDL